MFYPIFLDLRDRRVLVVGGGPVAERKVDALLEASARVVLVAPDVTPRLQQLAARKAIQLRLKKFEDVDLDGMLLVISATDDTALQERIASLARARGIPVNTVDRPRLCDFIVPAIVRRGDVVLAISTSGKSPALAAALRKRFDSVLGDDIARVASVLGEVREEVQARFPGAEQRKQVFEKIIDSGILDWIGECDDATALRRVREMIEKFA